MINNPEEYNEYEKKIAYSGSEEYFKSLHEDLKWLFKNPQFQRVILDGYLGRHILNQTSLLGLEHIIRNGSRTIIAESISATSHLQQYFIAIGNKSSSMFEDTEDEEGSNSN